MTTSLNFSYFMRYLRILFKTLTCVNSANDSEVINTNSVERAYQSSRHLKMCSRLSASLLQKGQKVLPLYFSSKFAFMSYILVLALKMTLAYFGLKAVKYVDWPNLIYFKCIVCRLVLHWLVKCLKAWCFILPVTNVFHCSLLMLSILQLFRGKLYFLRKNVIWLAQLFSS